jgi:hypothetical protein
MHASGRRVRSEGRVHAGGNSIGVAPCTEHEHDRRNQEQECERAAGGGGDDDRRATWAHREMPSQMQRCPCTHASACTHAQAYMHTWRVRVRCLCVGVYVLVFACGWLGDWVYVCGGYRPLGANVVRGSQPRGYPRVLKGELKSGIQAVLEVVKGAPHGTQGARGYSRKRIPDGATNGTTVGASVGEGVNGGVGAGVGAGVPAKPHAQRWSARH